MKKVFSLILAVCLVASLAICASAAKPTVVIHDQTAWETQNKIEHLACKWLDAQLDSFTTTEIANGQAYFGSHWESLDTGAYVSILSITEETEQTLTKCAEALTTKEGVAICEADERLNNLTVFRQRNVANENGPIDITVKLWPCNPARKSNQAVVILFRAEGTEEWTVVGYNNETNECSATLPGNGAYVVAMVW